MMHAQLTTEFVESNLILLNRTRATRRFVFSFEPTVAQLSSQPRGQ